MVARICEELRLRGDERVLDVGTGSGYQAAVLALLATEVHTIERIPELAERAGAALAEAGFTSVTVHAGDGSLGVPEHAPYGGIAVAAAAPEVPPPLLAQLALGALLVVPVGTERDQQLQVIEQAEGGPSVVHSVSCRFVPLVGEAGFAVSRPPVWAHSGPKDEGSRRR
jgi:protein-L-isoaspartate(D-aspartate) O-methyltransferase